MNANKSSAFRPLLETKQMLSKELNTFFYIPVILKIAIIFTWILAFSLPIKAIILLNFKHDAYLIKYDSIQISSIDLAVNLLVISVLMYIINLILNRILNNRCRRLIEKNLCKVSLKLERKSYLSRSLTRCYNNVVNFFSGIFFILPVSIFLFVYPWIALTLILLMIGFSYYLFKSISTTDEKNDVFWENIIQKSNVMGAVYFFSSVTLLAFNSFFFSSHDVIIDLLILFFSRQTTNQFKSVIFSLYSAHIYHGRCEKLYKLSGKDI